MYRAYILVFGTYVGGGRHDIVGNDKATIFLTFCRTLHVHKFMDKLVASVCMNAGIGQQCHMI